MSKLVLKICVAAQIYSDVTHFSKQKCTIKKRVAFLPKKNFFFFFKILNVFDFVACFLCLCQEFSSSKQLKRRKRRSRINLQKNLGAFMWKLRLKICIATNHEYLSTKFTVSTYTFMCSESTAYLNRVTN